MPIWLIWTGLPTERLSTLFPEIPDERKSGQLSRRNWSDCFAHLVLIHHKPSKKIRWYWQFMERGECDGFGNGKSTEGCSEGYADCGIGHLCLLSIGH